MWSRVLHGSVRSQVIILAVMPILLVLILDTIVDEVMQKGKSVPYAHGLAIKVEMLFRQISALDDPEQVPGLLAATGNAGITAETVSPAELRATEPARLDEQDIRVLVKALLPPNLEAVVRNETATGSLRNILVVSDEDGHVLALAFSDETPSPYLLTEHQIGLVLRALVVLVPVLLLSLYTGHMITAPVRYLASAAQSLDADKRQERPFAERGVRELRILAHALNNMQLRLSKMVDERTRMLQAISHDLRTPLTRLRLRVDRAQDGEFREAALADIHRLTEMLDDVMTYLSPGGVEEVSRTSDLPSLLRTVCNDFQDLGFDVAFDGPARLAFKCKPRALGRAVSNLVDNATKYGSRVSVALERADDGGARIDVSDNGPGIPPPLHERVLDPFYKVDSARSAAGFGLGLSIVSSIIRQHGGRLELANGERGGLVARIWLPSDTVIPKMTGT